MRKSPELRELMTRLPVECEQYSMVGEAIDLMKTHHVRHLPLMRGSRLVGIVSQTDLLRAQADHGEAVNEKPLVDFCHDKVLTALPTDLVSNVAQRMLDDDVRSVVIMDGGFVVGMFTTTDALRALATLFH